MGIKKTHLVGNSFGGAIALRIATEHPERIDNMVLMGSMGVHFDDHRRAWTRSGATRARIEEMRKVLDYFAYSRDLVNEELAQVRYKASIEPGFQESFSSMFPAPRQRWVDAMCTAEEDDQGAAAPHADRARPGGQGHPAGDLAQAGATASTTPTCRCSRTAGTGR